MHNPNKPNFTARKKARRLALQALYSFAMSDNSLSTIETFMLTDHPQDNLDLDYFQMLLHKVPTKLPEIEAAILPYIDRPLAELDPIEMAILRISVYELLFCKDIPYKVVINEGLELAKSFGASQSHKFINGVLDKVAKNLQAS